MFENRHEAGIKLAHVLKRYEGASPIILALPRGGVVIGYEIAKQLNVPLDVIVSRKLGASHDPEFGIGAIAEGNQVVLDEHSIRILGITAEKLQRIKEKEQKELERRVALYRQGNPLPALKNKTVILVDDGLATGVTAKAAIQTLRKKHPSKIVFASPVCSSQTAKHIRDKNITVICLTEQVDLGGISAYYQDFSQVPDDAVIELLKRSKHID